MTRRFTYWVTGKGTRYEVRWRRCTTCGQPESYHPRSPLRSPCPYKSLHRADQQPPQYTGGTPSS